jgi:hypothetical protein
MNNQMPMAVWRAGMDKIKAATAVNKRWLRLSEQFPANDKWRSGGFWFVRLRRVLGVTQGGR